MILKADFHNHSCLSPCGSLEMAPRLIAETLVSRGVQIAALTDHNSALNCPAFEHEAKKVGLLPLFGIEAQTSEECHILCLFDSVETSLILSEKIYDLLPPIMNNPSKLGDQVYVDEDENIAGEVDKFLLNSAMIDLEALTHLVHELGGLVIPAHVERTAFSLWSQLGAVVHGDWDALEVMEIPCRIDTLGYPLTTSSDAHYPDGIAKRTFELDFLEENPRRSDGRVDVEAVRRALSRRVR